MLIGFAFYNDVFATQIQWSPVLKSDFPNFFARFVQEIAQEATVVGYQWDFRAPQLV